MPDSHDHPAGRDATHQRPAPLAPPAPGVEGLPGVELPVPAGALLGDPRLEGRGNGPVRATVMRQAQQTYGNRAVRRYLQRADGPSSRLAPTPPTKKYLAPFDRNPHSAPGERIIFNAEYEHATPDDYQLVFSGTNGTFDSAGGA